MKNFTDFNAEDRIGVKLLENRTYYLAGEIDHDSVDLCIKWLISENQNVKEEKLLKLYINSTGGDLYNAFALIDIMKYSHHPIQVIGLGAVMSAAFLIFASGTKGYRFAAPNTSFMCHQFSSGTDGKYHDLKAEMKETEFLNKRMIEILKDATGMPPSKIKSKLLSPTDIYLTPEEVVELGIADGML